MKDLLFDLDRRAISMPLRDRRPVHQTGVTVFPVSLTPSVEAAAADAKVSTCLRDVAADISMLKNTKLARDLALILAHEHLLRPRIGSLLEMSREYRLVYSSDSTPLSAMARSKCSVQSELTGSADVLGRHRRLRSLPHRDCLPPSTIVDGNQGQPAKFTA